MVVIGIIIYFYHNYQGNVNVPEDNTVVIRGPKKLNNRQVNKRQVNGKNNNPKPKIKPKLTPKIKPNPKLKNKVNLEDIFASVIDTVKSQSSNCSMSVSLEFSDAWSDEARQHNLPLCGQGNAWSDEARQHNQNTNSSTDSNVKPSNLEDNNSDWDAGFGLPLMSKQEKTKFAEKIRQEHDDYTKSLGKFTKYKTDNSTIIKTDVTIDPFKPPKPNRYNPQQGRSIKDIYDEQVAGPKAIQKKIIGKTSSGPIYENEDEMNGGQIKGSKTLFGYDCANDKFKNAVFGDEF